MRKSIYACIVVLAVGVTISCSKKSVPVIMERKREPKQVETSKTAITPDLAAGKRIFTNRCGNCHALPKPGDYTAEKWEKIMSYMGPRARLNTEQDIHVLAYLEANAAN